MIVRYTNFPIKILQVMYCNIKLLNIVLMYLSIDISYFLTMVMLSMSSIMTSSWFGRLRRAFGKTFPANRESL